MFNSVRILLRQSEIDDKERLKKDDNEKIEEPFINKDANEHKNDTGKVYCLFQFTF